MPYVRRNERGEIIALHATCQPGAEEELPADHPEILDFLGAPPDGARTHALLAESDRQLTRVLEDLITLLAERNVIRLTDLPPEAQKKLLLRK